MKLNRELNKCVCLVSWETLRIRVEFLSLTGQREVQYNGTLCSFTQKALCSYLFVGRHQADRHTALSAPSPACPSSQEPPHSWLMRTGRRHIYRGRTSLEFLGHHVDVYQYNSSSETVKLLKKNNENKTGALKLHFKWKITPL